MFSFRLLCIVPVHSVSHPRNELICVQFTRALTQPLRPLCVVGHGACNVPRDGKASSALRSRAPHAPVYCTRVPFKCPLRPRIFINRESFTTVVQVEAYAWLYSISVDKYDRNTPNYACVPSSRINESHAAMYCN